MFLCLVMLSLPVAVQAQEDTHSTCTRWRLLAWQIMHARQSNVPMRAEQQAMRGKPGQPTVDSLVSKAYDEPVFAVTEKKWKAEKEFSESVYAVCREQLDGPQTPGREK